MRVAHVLVIAVLVSTGCASRLGPTPARDDTAPIPLAARSFAPCRDAGSSRACAPCCPPSAALRPSDGWACREARLREPPTTPAEATIDAYRLQRARTRSWGLAGLGVAATAAYGFLLWEFGTADFYFKDEGGFGEYTTHGGADKAGHVVAAHMFTAIAAALNRSWGLGRKEAALRGAAASMFWMIAIELGDATAEDHGFSTGDLIADVVGCVAGYLHESSPWIHRAFDLRWEYFPSPSRFEGDVDITIDYSGSSYLIAVNVGALVSRQPTHWDLLDIQFGYQTRGYREEDLDAERWVYVGAGLNLANLLRRVGFRYAAIFDYFQVPFISLRLGYELNDGETGLLYAP